MRESTRLAVRMTLIIGILYSIGLAYLYFISTIKITHFIGIFIVFIIFTFLVIRLHTESYIYQKIQVIYKTIRDQKRNKSKHFKDKQKALPSIDNVHHEVIAWSKDYQDHIQELQKLEVYRREYIGNISHELKTPLFNIQGYISTLLDGGLEDEKINIKFLERSVKSVDRLIKIVEELDTISSIESGEMVLNKTKFNVIELVNEVFDFYEDKANSINCHLGFNKKYDSPIFVYADRKHILTLFSNLIANAIKYGDADKGKIKIGFFDMNENVLVEITDNGPGMNKEELPRIFERFYRSDKARARDSGGTGLGLAIVKHIVEAHNQVINVRSTAGLGSTFAFTIKKA